MSEPREVLSVVVPAFDEVDTLEACVKRVLASPYVGEVVVVDDGSTDGTAAVAESLAATEPRVRCILHPENRGKGAALRTGFAAATMPFLLVQDADLEYDPADYEQMLGPLLAGKADVVYGSRFVTGGPHRVLYFWHSIGNRILTLLSNMVTNLNLTDMETGYKAFRRELIEAIDIEEDGFGVEPEITAKLARMRVRFYEVGISYSGRTYEDGKKIGWRDGVRALYCVLKYGTRRA